MAVSGAMLKVHGDGRGGYERVQPDGFHVDEEEGGPAFFFRGYKLNLIDFESGLRVQVGSRARGLPIDVGHGLASLTFQCESNNGKV